MPCAVPAVGHLYAKRADALTTRIQCERNSRQKYTSTLRNKNGLWNNVVFVTITRRFYIRVVPLVRLECTSSRRFRSRISRDGVQWTARPDGGYNNIALRQLVGRERKTMRIIWQNIIRSSRATTGDSPFFPANTSPRRLRSVRRRVARGKRRNRTFARSKFSDKR